MGTQHPKIANSPLSWGCWDLWGYIDAMSAQADGPATRSSDVLARLAEIVQLVTGRPVEEVRLERTFVDELRIDSLAMVEILEGSAQHFGVRIEDEDAKYFVRVRDLVQYVATRLG
jgi:acyl carrier protein